MGVCTKERKGVTAEVLMATPCTNSLGGESGGHVRGDGFAGSSPPFLGRERAAVVLMLVRSAAAPFPDDDDVPTDR